MVRNVKRLWDEERTALLNQSELLVEKGKGGPDYFLAWLDAIEYILNGDDKRVPDYAKENASLLLDAIVREEIILP